MPGNLGAWRFYPVALHYPCWYCATPPRPSPTPTKCLDNPSASVRPLLGSVPPLAALMIHHLRISEPTTPIPSIPLTLAVLAFPYSIPRRFVPRSPQFVESLIPVKGVEPLEIDAMPVVKAAMTELRSQSPLLVLFYDFLEGRKVILGDLYGWPLIGHITLKKRMKGASGKLPAPVRLVRKYEKLKKLIVPTLPKPPANASSYTPMTPSTSSSSLPPLPPLSGDFFSSSADSPASASIAVPAITWSNSPITPSSSSSISAPSLRAAKHSKWEKMDDLLSSYGFLSLGDFLDVLFHNHARDEPDPRTPRHIAAVNKFLSGSNTFRMSHLIECLYHHRESRPKRRHTAERAAAFSPHIPLEDIHFTQPSLSAWATRLVGNRIHDSVGTLARKNRDDSESHTHFTIEGLAQKYATNAELVWYLTECMAAPRKKGVVVIRKRRPPPRVAAISSFILSRNQYASGDLALPLGIWHFVCKSHIDVKRVYCRFGSIISDTTVRTSLNTMTETSIEALQTDVHRRPRRMNHHGLGRDNQLKVGTACTAVRYEDCKPGAFNADDHVVRVIAQERQTMTAESIFSSIDWTHNQAVACLHFVRVLAEFVPELTPLRAQITTHFRTAPIAKHLLPEDRKTINQPIGTNAKHELELKARS
ncbi:hypothetical protein B0H14DRAFT_3461138 [Mycena olivaceomarginata]|nr:hypothetical protein B0H14DRAFT_3461138 [Mycena olivaceomarginata]